MFESLVLLYYILRVDFRNFFLKKKEKKLRNYEITNTVILGFHEYYTYVTRKKKHIIL